MKNKMKKILILMVTMLYITACSTDLDQTPDNASSSDTLTDYEPVLRAAYGYHFDAVGPMAIFGDFRSDNALFDETPFTDFDMFGNNNLTSSMTNDFFKPFYAALYKSILSANGVIENSTDATQIGEAKFIRALSYYKLILVFGDVTVNLLATPDLTDTETLARQPKNDVYNNVVIPDLKDAMSALGSSNAAAANGRATKNAAQALLGKVYAAMGNYTAAATELKAVIDGANAAGIKLQTNFADIFGATNDLNSEIIFATQMSSTASISSSSTDIFTNWYSGANTKADAADGAPIDQDLIDAFAASTGDVRSALTVSGTVSVKYPGSATDQDWIEIRLADVMLLYAEALNESTNTSGAQSASILSGLDPIRTRAGLASLSGTATTQATVRQAILNERRLELACEGHRWFDLVRLDAVSSGLLSNEMGETINSNYHVFPIPNTETTSFPIIKQNAGY